MNTQKRRSWYGDWAVWLWIGRRYLPWLVTLNLAWEAAQLPLYKLWTEGSPGFIAFSVVHCTLGDAIIGTVALVLALVATRAPALAHWRWVRIAAATVIAGVTYTVISEWTNLALDNWTYSALMPVLPVLTVEIGLSPLAQWLLLPPLALWLATRPGGP